MTLVSEIQDMLSFGETHSNVNLIKRAFNCPAWTRIDLALLTSAAILEDSHARASTLLSSVPDLPATTLTLSRKPGHVNCRWPKWESAETLTKSEVGVYDR